MTEEQIRKANARVLARITLAQEKCAAIKLKYDFEWELIEASRHNLPGRKLDTEEYIKHKGALGELENRLERAEQHLSFRESVFKMLPTPKPRRPVRTVRVDGIRTKIERETER